MASREVNTRLLVAAVAFQALFLVLAIVVYVSGRTVRRDTSLISDDAVPGSIEAHAMRSALADGIHHSTLAAISGSASDRSAHLEAVRASDTAFRQALERYRSTIHIDVSVDNTLSRELIATVDSFAQLRLRFDSVVVLGNRDVTLPLLEAELLPAYRAVSRSADALVSYNHANAARLARSIAGNMRQLQWAALVIVLLALVCAGAVAANLAVRAREEGALRASELRLRAIMDGLFAFVGLVDLDGRLVEVNRAALEAAGVKRDEVLHHQFHETPWWSHDAEMQARLQQSLRDAAAGTDSRYDVENRLGDGTIATLDFSCSPLRDADGRITLLLVAGVDITERKRIEAQFRHSQRLEAMGRLAGGVAHDFNNLLCVIHGYCEFLSSELPEGSSGHGDVQEIASASRRAAELTHQLLAFSRSQALSPRVISPNDIVRGMDKMLRRLIGTDVDIRVLLDDDVGAVRADPGQLEQVIVNLVVNARDAMPDGGRLTIQTSLVEFSETVAEQRMQLGAGRYVVLAVSDTGIGMSETVRARIFEPFFTTKDVGRGTGLGLATVLGIVQQSAGAVWVYSEPGEGATFKVYLPWVSTDEKEESVVPGHGAPPRGTESVMVVDDDPQVRALMERTLAGHGYRVISFVDGGAAMEHLDTQPTAPDMLITDVVMPRARGPEVAARMRVLWPAMRVLYVTGYTDRLIEPGTPNVLHKPFAPSVLLRTVREVLERT